ncbi:CDP-alcohol phosphatidyltransferase family protein [Jeotgalibaca sp. A127]|uniref:CDP-alcohol phosphatidyltransferase family protein n=1 Tax=Jeotgalibaca sp. A127 TaxID=3457324 RepID=UPI003FD210D4
MYKVIPAFHRSNLLSLLGLFLSLMSMRNIFQGQLDAAIILFVFSGLCDLFDGKFARLFKRDEKQQQMGEYIDSFVDMVSFIALPIAFLFQLLEGQYVPLILATLYAVCGVHRLGYFHIIKGDAFIGMPLTYITLTLTVTYAFFSLFGAVESALFRATVALIYFILPLGFIWNVPVARPSGKMYILFIILAIIVLVIVGSRL